MGVFITLKNGIGHLLKIFENLFGLILGHPRATCPSAPAGVHADLHGSGSGDLRAESSKRKREEECIV